MSGGNGPCAFRRFQAGDYALFWDKDVRLARALEAMGVRLYNTAAAVAVCDDKAATHLELARRGVPMPRTLVAPMTYVNMDAQGDAFLRRGAETLGFPLVVKECFGSLGGQVYLAATAASSAVWPIPWDPSRSCSSSLSPHPPERTSGCTW